MIFNAFLLDACHERSSEAKKPTSLLIVLIGKTFNGIPPS